MENISYNEFMKQQEQNLMLSQNPSQQQMMVQQNKNMQIQDPFMSSQYQNVRVPDVPISYSGGIADSLLNNSEVPEEVQKKYWFAFHKDNVLTFLDEERKRSKLLNIDIIKTDILTTMPYYDYSFEQELEFDIIRNVFETKLDRALGFSGTGQKNERIILQSQFSENRNINENDNSMIKESFFKRLLGRR
jgi:hypothetical protein